MGNIPYDGTEADLLPILQQVGTVVQFKLVQDHEAGRHKGFGFCEYADDNAADRAIAELAGADFRGRYLKL